MADRLPQYPMPNFNNNLLQQQLQQLQPQQHQDQHSNIPNQALDQNRVWQMQQMQQFRNNAAQDMNQHSQAQIAADFMKRQQAIRQQQQLQQQQQQHQQQHPHQQQPFLNAGMPQMGGARVMGGNGQQAFHDAASGHSQQNHVQGGFPNPGMPNGNMNPAAAAALQGARNPQALLQGLPNHARQLELMNMAQNQQPQNGPVNLNKFNPQQLQQQQHAQMQQQQQSQQQQFPLGMNQPSPGDVFSSPGMSNESLRRPSPHPSNIQQAPGMPQGAQPPQQGNMLPGANGGPRMMLPANELQNRLASMRPLLMQTEAILQDLNRRLNAIRGTDPAEEAKIVERIKETTAEYNKRKDYAGKLVMGLQIHQKAAVAQGQAQQMNGNGGNGGPGQGQSPWAPHPGQGAGFVEGLNGQATRAQMGQMAGQTPHSLQASSMQSSPSLQHAPSQGGHPANQPPPRPMSTPQQSGPQQHQGVGNPFNNMPSNSMSGSLPFPNNPQAPPVAGPSQPTMSGGPGGNPMMNTFGVPQSIAPLEKTRFDPAFRNFCLKRNVKPDVRLLSIENRPVDLHALHVQVIQEGGMKQVEAKEAWPIIGGRLGFIQFPGDENTPAKSGPGVANQLEHIYREYIVHFDQWYISQIMDARRAQIAGGDIQTRMAGLRWTPQQMQAVVSMSQLSVAELHAQNIDEKMIQFVEANRASLQRTFQEQRSFTNRLRVNQTPNGAQGPEQNGGPGPRPPGMGPNPTFPVGSPAQSNPTLTMTAQQQMMNQQLSQQHQQQQSGQQQLLGGPNGLPVNRMPQQSAMPQQGIPRGLNAALPIIQKMKQDFMANNFNNMPTIEIPPGQLHEYNRMLEQVHRQCTEADQRIAMMLGVLKNEEQVRKMVQIVCTVQHQRLMLSTTNSPRYMVSLENLRGMSSELQRIVDTSNQQFTLVMRNNPQMSQLFASNAMMMHQQQQQQQHQSQQQPMGGNVMVPPNPVMGTSDMSQHARPPVPHRPPSVVASSPPTNQTLRPPAVALQPPPLIKRKPQQSTGAVSTPSPAPVPSASTPVASAPTPTAVASSPPASTKSPKTKAAPKPKAGAKQRRTSKVVPPAVPPAPEPTQPAASSSSGSVKRPREEEPTASSSAAANGGPAVGVANEPSPPKRAKTEWESQPSAEQRKKSEAVDNIKTQPEATAFFEQMTELIKRAAEEDGQEALTSDISETIDMILKGCAPGPDSVDMLGESSTLREPSPPPPMNDSFDEFFDFSFGTVEDEDHNSKAPTPDLVSSTNPSPESNHEAEGAHHLLASSSSSTIDMKTEELSDMLRLGPWKEIDGGEATYFQTSEWKWDSPMTSTDPWAIFNS